MKTAFALALLLSVAPLPAAAADAEFDPKEKISLDLRDAKIADLVTTLGALANLPVYIDPDVSGTITIKLDDVPFEKVLMLINGKTGVSVRIENGKLVASRSTQSFLAAVTLPDQYKSASRLRVAEISKVTPSAPLFVRTKLNGASSCHRLEFIDGERPTITFPVAENEGGAAAFRDAVRLRPGLGAALSRPGRRRAVGSGGRWRTQGDGETRERIDLAHCSRW